MYSTQLPLNITGHVKIEDDLGEVFVDKDNAVHPQNMSRVIARALSNENNYAVHRIAFGNGGTEIDAAFTITFKTPNDGQPPDIQTWESRLYNETYSEIVDDSNVLLGTDPGSAGPKVGTRAGGGARPENDPVSVEHVSGPGVRSRELGLTSEVVITAVLNPSEPTGQITSSTSSNSLNSSFTFDEIGLYTTGAKARASAGVQDVDVSNKTSTDVTGLQENKYYSFDITVDGGGLSPVTFQAQGINPTYGDLIEALNNPTTPIGLAWKVNGMPAADMLSITDTTFGAYPSIDGAQTFGFLRFTSKTTGSTSSITLAPGGLGNDDGSDQLNALDLFAALPGLILQTVPGENKGVQNIATSFEDEQERLLTHLLFAPVLKAADRTLTITYTLTISVARTQA